MKITNLRIISKIDTINDNLRKKNVKIDLKEYITIDRETIEFNTENISLGLLNTLRQVAYKFDYVFYLNTELSDVTVKFDNKFNSSFVDRSGICFRLNGLIIDNNDEEALSKHLNTSIGNVNKIIKLDTHDKNEEFIYSDDINYIVPNLIKMDKKNINYVIYLIRMV